MTESERRRAQKAKEGRRKRKARQARKLGVLPAWQRVRRRVTRHELHQISDLRPGQALVVTGTFGPDGVGDVEAFLVDGCQEGEW